MTLHMWLGTIPLMDGDWKQRLRDLLDARGESMKSASKKAGKGETFVRDMLERNKIPSVENFALVARVLGVTPAEILNGSDDDDLEATKVVGYVGAGSQAHLYSRADDPNETFISRYAPPGTVAVKIRGESLGKHFDGWYALYDEVRSPVTPDLYGETCVVELEDGRVLVKKIIRSQTKGRYHLESNGNEPTIYDAKVLWAAKVRSYLPPQAIHG